MARPLMPNGKMSGRLAKTTIVMSLAAPSKRISRVLRPVSVSPAVRDYLGLSDVDSADWGFVTVGQVPNGPWKVIISSDLGDSVN